MDSFEEKLVQCIFLDPERNPVLRTQGSVITAIEQYSALPMEIAAMLQTAANRTSCWPEVASELALNRAEELGSETGGIPHVEILASGIKRELGVSLKDVVQTPDTSQFIHALHHYLKTQSVAKVAGAVFALEHSAVPELKIVGAIINTAKMQIRESSVERVDDSSWLNVPLATFIQMHTDDFEIKHRDRLWTALRPYRSKKSILLELEVGFDFVLSKMDRWWEAMALTAQSPEN